MFMLNKTVSTVKNNPIGLVVGAGLGYWGVKKYTSNSKMWVTALGVIVGGVIGSYAQGMIGAKRGARASSRAAKK